MFKQWVTQEMSGRHLGGLDKEYACHPDGVSARDNESDRHAVLKSIGLQSGGMSQ
jgi:hypothetical protein